MTTESGDPCRVERAKHSPRMVSNRRRLPRSVRTSVEAIALRWRITPRYRRCAWISRATRRSDLASSSPYGFELGDQQGGLNRRADWPNVTCSIGEHAMDPLPRWVHDVVVVFTLREPSGVFKRLDALRAISVRVCVAQLNSSSRSRLSHRSRSIKDAGIGHIGPLRIRENHISRHDPIRSGDRRRTGGHVRTTVKSRCGMS